MPIYYEELDNGACGLRTAKTKRRAWREFVREEGTEHAVSIRLATPDDIADVKAMGGWVPVPEQNL